MHPSTEQEIQCIIAASTNKQCALDPFPTGLVKSCKDHANLQQITLNRLISPGVQEWAGHSSVEEANAWWKRIKQLPTEIKSGVYIKYHIESGGIQAQSQSDGEQSTRTVPVCIPHAS